MTWETQRRSRLEIESGGVWVRVPIKNCLSVWMRLSVRRDARIWTGLQLARGLAGDEARTTGRPLWPSWEATALSALFHFMAVRVSGDLGEQSGRRLLITLMSSKISITPSLPHLPDEVVGSDQIWSGPRISNCRKPALENG